MIPQAIEEVLRYEIPVQAAFRQASDDVQLEGAKIARVPRLPRVAGPVERVDALLVRGLRSLCLA